MTVNKMNHVWTLEDENYLINEIVGNWNKEDWGELKRRIADNIGTSLASVSAKIQNHRYTLGLGGNLKNTSVLGDQAIMSAYERYGLSKAKWDTILK